MYTRMNVASKTKEILDRSFDEPITSISPMSVLSDVAFVVLDGILMIPMRIS